MKLFIKKTVSFILTVAFCLSLLIPLAGCKGPQPELTLGQWLSLISDSFYMVNYVSEKPYFARVSSDNPYFSVFQSAAEWEIIAPSDTVSDTDPLTYELAMTSLVNAGEFLPSSATEEEKMDYAIAHFDPDYRKYNGKHYIKFSEAIELLDIAQSQWANKTIDDPIEEAKFTDKVTDLSQRNFSDFLAEDNKVIMRAADAADLKVGSYYVLPSDGTHSASLNRVEDIVFDGDYAYILNADTISDEELAECAESIIVRETEQVDFSRVTGIYDEFGNPIVCEQVNGSAGWMNMEGEAPQASFLGKLGTEGAYSPTGTEVSLTFTIKGFKVSVSFKGNSASIELKKEFDKKTNQMRDAKTTEYIKVNFDNVKLTKDIDMSWGKIKAATLKIDYKSKISTGVKVTTNNKVGLQDADGSDVLQSLSDIVSGYGEALKKIGTDVYNTKYNDESVYICRISLAEGGLASVDFIVKGVVTVTGDMQIVLELAGAQGVEYKNGNIRYINSKTSDVDFIVDGKVEATISPGFAITVLKRWNIGEILLDLGVGIEGKYITHLFDVEGHEVYSKKDVTLSADGMEELGEIQWNISSEELLKLAESVGGTWDNYSPGSSINLESRHCFEWKIYPILRLNLGDGLLPELLSKLNIKVTVNFVPDVTIAEGHIDFGTGYTLPSNIENAILAIGDSNVGGGLAALLGVGAECAFKPKPWDDVIEQEDEKDEDSDQDEEVPDVYEVAVADGIMLSTMRVFLEPGESECITITGLPEGYKLTDVVGESEDPEIATFDAKHGKITAGGKEGTTQIVIRTEDNKYKTFCAVSVYSSTTITVGALPGGQL